MSQENVETVRSISEAFGKLLAAIHPEISCHDRPGHPNAREPWTRSFVRIYSTEAEALKDVGLAE
jgi:hypothetical protein